MSSICQTQNSNRKRWLQNRQKTARPSALAVLLITLLWSALMLIGCTQQSKIPNEVPSPRPVISEEAAHQLSERVSKALQTPGPLHLNLTEEELTSYLALNAQSLPLEAPTLRLIQGQLWFWAKIAVWSHPVICGELNLTCDKGQIRVHLNQAWLNGQRLPRFLLASVEQAANDALADIQLPLQVEHISIGDGTMVITGTVHYD
jgi:hypothetical protein